MVKRSDLSHDFVRSVLDYDPLTGIFRWKKQLSPTSPVGSIAGCQEKNSRYVRIGLCWTYVLAHRLAWFYVYGVFPKHGLDHRDQNKSNNAISNLREATFRQNVGNKRRHNGTASKWKGVFRSGKSGWRARLTTKERHINLGSFRDEADAAMAYNEAALEYFGEFACLNDNPANHEGGDDF